MGYRSEVAIAVYGEHKVMNDVITYFNQGFEKLSDDSKEFIKDGIKITDNKIIIHYDEIKWYDDRDFVQFFEDVWKYAESFDADGINGEYLIIGEELSDIEEKSFGNDRRWYIELTRSMTINTDE